MNAQMTFDTLHPSDPRAVIARPRARTSDGVTAHAAAKKMESGNGPMMAAIRFVMRDPYPASAFAIADAVRQFYRDDSGKPFWKHDSIRSAVSRAPFLRHVDNEGTVPDTGNACRRYVLKEEA